MNHIEALIGQYCPNGVKVKTLGEIGQLFRGNGLQKSDFTNEGIGCIHYGQIYTHYKAFVYKTKSFVSEELANKLRKVQSNDIVITATSENIEDVCKSVAWLGEEEIVIGGHSIILKHKENPKYLVYFFQSTKFFKQKKKYARGTKVIEISVNDLSKIKIPVPPLPIQQEIVNILDKFTQLEAELEAELEARKVQYEYYRNEIFSFEGKDVEWLTLGNIISLEYGKPLKNNSREQGTYPVYGSNGVVGYHSNYLIKGPSIIIGRKGSAGAVTWCNCDCFPIDTAFYVQLKTKDIRLRYLYHFLKHSTLLPHIQTSGVPGLNRNDAYTREVAVPSLQSQDYIIGVLDNFDRLVNSFSSGLPAEINARKKQYEYYRNKLLTFKELEA